MLNMRCARVGYEMRTRKNGSQSKDLVAPILTRSLLFARTLFVNATCAGMPTRSLVSRASELQVQRQPRHEWSALVRPPGGLARTSACATYCFAIRCDAASSSIATITDNVGRRIGKSATPCCLAWHFSQ